MAPKCNKAKVIHKSDETLKVVFLSVRNEMFYPFRESFVTILGNVISDSASMSNEGFWETQNHLLVESFLRSINIGRVNQYLRNF